jgi:hypothetical protein
MLSIGKSANSGSLESVATMDAHWIVSGVRAGPLWAEDYGALHREAPTLLAGSEFHKD